MSSYGYMNALVVFTGVLVWIRYVMSSMGRSPP